MKTNTEPLKVGDECREAFEQWKDDTGNGPPHTAMLWECWQAAWNRRAEPSPAEAKVGMQLIRADVVEFLRGAGLLDGCAFGERPLGAEGEFWWRQYLPDEETAEVSSEGPSSLAIAGIGQRHFGNPIPKEWYAAAKDLVKSCQALSQQSKKD